MFLRAFVFVAVTFFLGPANAVEVAWAMAAPACTPVHTAGSNYKVGVGSVEHGGSSTGLLVLNCPVTRFTTMATTFSLHIRYRDSTGTSQNGFVRARLWHYDGIEDSEPKLLASVNSNSSPIKGDNNVSTSFPHTFSFDEGIYWVRIELERTTPQQTVVVYSVSLPVP